MPTHRSTHADTHAGTSTRSSSRAGSTARNEILAMLKDDHKRVKKSFRDFEKLDPHEDPERCESLVQRTCGELEMHAALEEELFYPAARECIGEEDLIDEAEVEHMTVKTLIAKLKDMSPEDEKFAAMFKVLGEYVVHHIKEEESEIFQQLSHAKFDWQELQTEMMERRSQLMEQYAPQSMAEQPKGEAGGAGKGRGASASSSRMTDAESESEED